MEFGFQIRTEKFEISLGFTRVNKPSGDLSEIPLSDRRMMFTLEMKKRQVKI